MKTTPIPTLALACACAYFMAGCTGADNVKQADPPAPVIAPAPAPMAPPAPVEAEAEVPATAIDLGTLALSIDPVCRMSLEEYPATATAEHDGKIYGFCAPICKKKFLEAPEKILTRLQAPVPGAGV